MTAVTSACATSTRTVAPAVAAAVAARMVRLFLGAAPAGTHSSQAALPSAQCVSLAADLAQAEKVRSMTSPCFAAWEFAPTRQSLQGSISGAAARSRAANPVTCQPGGRPPACPRAVNQVAELPKGRPAAGRAPPRVRLSSRWRYINGKRFARCSDQGDSGRCSLAPFRSGELPAPDRWQSRW
jgi:hypothetical protein